VKVYKLTGRHIASNTYVVLNGGNAIIVDAGAKLQDVLNVLDELGDINVSAVLLTHSHFDHVLHLNDYIKHFDCNVYIDIKGINNLKDPRLNASELFRMPISITNKRIMPLPENTITIGDIVVDIVRTHGHTNDSVCYVIDDMIFTGDTIFADGVGRVDLPTSSISDMQESLLKLEKYNHIIHYPGHGDDF